MTSIPLYHTYQHLMSSGGQPTAEQLAELAREHFQVVVNLSTPDAKNYLPEEAAIVENLGMTYVHFPLNCSDLKPMHYQIFRSILLGVLGQKTFVHCAANVKSSHLMHMFQVLELGRNEDHSLKELIQIETPAPKWIAYFKNNGMQGA